MYVLSIDILHIKLFKLILSEIPLPNEQSRADILKIHAAPIAKHGEIGILHFYLNFNIPYHNCFPW